MKNGEKSVNGVLITNQFLYEEGADLKFHLLSTIVTKLTHLFCKQSLKSVSFVCSSQIHSSSFFYENPRRARKVS